jgi:hypothetical protein
VPIGDAPRTLAGSMADGQYGALALDLYETIPSLTYPLSTQTYNKMRFDPQISAVLNAYSLPLRAGRWVINPTGCRDEVVQLCADAWGLPIMGDGDDPGPFRRRGVMWDDHLRVALLMLPFGHSPFAVRYDVTGTPLRARLAELSERLPQTITDIVTNADGSLKEIRQSSVKQPIPAKSLLWYVHNREGAAWQGQSMIRSAYAPWLLKHELWRVLATSSRRFGMGVPQVTAPAGGTPADIQAAADLAAGYRAGDQSGIGLPDGFRFDLTGLNGSVPDTLGFVRYLDQQIATSCLASVMNLDTSQTGNRALGDTLISLLELAWEATAKEVAVPASRLNVQMVDYNWGEDEPVPAVLCTKIPRQVVSEAVAALVTCGALTPDLGMENELRSVYRLPQIDSRPDPVAPAPSTGTPDDAPTSTPGNPGAPATPGPADPVPAGSQR